MASFNMRQFPIRLGLRLFSSSRVEVQQADSLTAFGTRRIFDSDHDAVRDTARKFFTEEVVPHHEQWEEQGHISRECWREAGKAGLLLCNTPEEFGGGGLDFLSAAVVWEEQSYSLCTGPGFSLHSDIVAPYLLHYGSKEQKEKFLPRMATGELITAIAMTEPGAGSDLQGIKTTALPAGGGSTDLILNGSKTFITNGFMSDMVIVVARTDPNAQSAAKGMSLVIVEKGMAGFEKGKKPLDKLGLRAQDTCELFFNDVRIPKENILGSLNKGFAMLMQELPQERLLIADMSQSAAEAAFEVTRTYLKDRKAFGAPLIKQQLLVHRMAKLKTQLAVSRAFVDSCLALHQEKRLDSASASMAKMHASDTQAVVADECVQLHGGNGFMWNYPVTKHFADARVNRIYGGTNEIMAELIARTIDNRK